jgi:hypothetical protein
LKEVTNDVLSDIDQKIRLVSRVDSICVTCSKLRENICFAKINDDLLMRDYNDNLDDKLFDVMKLSPESEITVRSFLEIVNINISSIVAQFRSPSNNSEVRRAGTVTALNPTHMFSPLPLPSQKSQNSSNFSKTNSPIPHI